MAKSAISRQNPRVGTDTKSGYLPMDRDQVAPVPKSSGTGSHSQNRVGTGTDASGNLDFFTVALLSPDSYTDSIGTLIND